MLLTTGVCTGGIVAVVVEVLDEAEACSDTKSASRSAKRVATI